MIDAYCDLDPGKMAEIFAEEDRERAQANFERLFSQYYSCSTDNLKMEIISKTGNTAKIKVRYNLTLTHFCVKENGYAVTGVAFKFRNNRKRV